MYPKGEFGFDKTLKSNFEPQLEPLKPLDTKAEKAKIIRVLKQTPPKNILKVKKNYMLNGN